MNKVKRFYWVRSPKGGKLHIKFGNKSEGPTKCGINVPKGWWIMSPWHDEKCKRCCHE